MSTPIEMLNKLLESGKYQLQSRLPAERDLAKTLGISRSRLRKALAQLEAQNRIWRHVGRGTFVGLRPAIDNKSGILELTKTTNPSEIMETRQIIEPKIAAIAALRSTQNELERMELCLNRAESIKDFDSFEHWDSALHIAIAESTHNLLLLSILKTIKYVENDNIWGRLKKAAMTCTLQKTYLRQHRNLVNAIQNRDSTNAEKIMRIHLETIQKNLIGSI